MREVVAVVSGKEKEGKTTLTVNLAVLMAQKGFRTAIFDFDPKYAALSMVGQIEDIPLTVKNVVEGLAEIDDVFYSGVSGVLSVPIGMKIYDFRKSRLNNLLERTTELADILFIDVPGGFGRESILSIAASTLVINVLNPTVKSLESSLAIPLAAERLKANFLGVVLNGLGKKEVEINEIEALIGNVIAEIPHDEAVKRANAVGRPVVISSPMSEATRAFKELADAFNTWLESFEVEKRELVARMRLLRALALQ